MTDRLEVTKTYKLFINGQFPRSESGRSMEVTDRATGSVAHVCRASRKDLRDAVTAARAAHPGWLARDAYNRGQILYRMAEMMEGKRRELEEAIGEAEGKAQSTKHKAQAPPVRGARAAIGKPARKTQDASRKPGDEVAAAIDRLIAYAGWADKFAQVLGCNNAVAGPYYNFTVPEGTGVCAVVAPDERPLLALISLLAPPLCGGCTVVALASEANPIPACILGEIFATSDVPAGVVNILTGQRAELVSWIAEHRDIDSVHGAGLEDGHARALRAGAAENVKRVTVRDGVDWFDAGACESPWWIERFVEMKTIWHPSSA